MPGADRIPGAPLPEVPHLAMHLLPPGKPRPLMIVCPGGGYSRRAPHEGDPVAQWLGTLGFSAAVLHYRVAPVRHPYPWMDAKRAIRLVRHHAPQWGVDPHRIGVLGFSAGGHLASMVSTHWDEGDASADDPVERQSCRPDFAVLCYPVISFRAPLAHAGCVRNLLGEPPDEATLRFLSTEEHVDAQTPPAFLWHTADDAAVSPEHSLAYAAALGRHRVPFSLHIFPRGRHGLGLAAEHPDVARWTELCAEWFAAMSIL